MHVFLFIYTYIYTWIILDYQWLASNLTDLGATKIKSGLADHKLPWTIKVRRLVRVREVVVNWDALDNARELHKERIRHVLNIARYANVGELAQLRRSYVNFAVEDWLAVQEARPRLDADSRQPAFGSRLAFRQDWVITRFLKENDYDLSVIESQIKWLYLDYEWQPFLKIKIVIWFVWWLTSMEIVSCGIYYFHGFSIPFLLCVLINVVFPLIVRGETLMFCFLT